MVHAGNPSLAKDQITAINILNALDLTEPPYSGFEKWDASEALDGSVQCVIIPGSDMLAIVGNGSGKIALNPDSSKLFYGFMNATMIRNAHLLDTSNVENFSQAFCVVGIPTQNSTALTSIDVSTWDVGNCTNMSMMFAGNWHLSTIDVSNWDVSNVTNFNSMFMTCSGVQALNVSKWNVSNATNINYMFAWCYGLTELDVSNWNVSPEKIAANTYMTFYNLTGLKKLDLRWFPFEATETFNLFATCNNLEELLLPNNWLSKTTSLQGFFQNLSSLKTLNTSNWDTSNVTDMSFMFYGCTGLKEIDVSNWDVSKVKNFDHFAAHANLRRKGIENWDTSSCENMNAMFHNCAEEELDLSNFKTDKVQFFCQMFENSPNLKRIKGLDKWNTSNAVGFEQMFGRCYALEELDLSAFDTTKAKNDVKASTNGHTTLTLQNFCNDCRNLKWIKLGPNFAVNGDGSNTVAANKLILPTTDPAYIDGADGNWYTLNGDSFAPTEAKDKTAETYYASYGIVADMDVIVKNGSMIDAAKAIREKNGTTNRYNPTQFGAAIRAL